MQLGAFQAMNIQKDIEVHQSNAVAWKRSKKLTIERSEPPFAINQLENLDFDKVPETQQEMKKVLKNSQIHYEATKTGPPDMEQYDKVSSQNCNDLFDNETEKFKFRKELPISLKSQFFDFLGSGFPLYFHFLQFSVIFLIVLFLSTGGFNFISNGLMGKYCEEKDSSASNHNTTSTQEHLPPCRSSFATRFSLVNKLSDTELIHMQQILNLFGIIATILVLQVFRTQQREVDNQADDNEITAADFTLMIEHIPLEYPTQIEFNNFEGKRVVLDNRASDWSAYLRNLLRARYSAQDSVYDAEYDGEIHRGEDQMTLQEKQKFIVQPVIEQVNLTYDLTSYYTKVGEKNKIIERLKSALSSNNTQETKKVKDELAVIEKEINDTLANHSSFTGVAFVTFDKEINKDKVIDQTNLNFWERLFRIGVYQPFTAKNADGSEAKLRITQAVEPSDVFWENLHYSDGERRKKLAISNFGVAFLLFISFLIVFKLSLYQQNLETSLRASQQDSTNGTLLFFPNHSTYENSHNFISEATSNSTASNSSSSSSEHDPAETELKNKIKLYSQIIGFLIQALNILISMIIPYLVASEKHRTKTDYNLSLASKTAIALFWNSGFQTFIISVIIPWYNFNLSKAQLSIFAASGLIVNQNQVLLQNAIINPVKFLVDPAYWIKRLNIWLNERKSIEERPNYSTQNQLNRLYELPEFEIAQKYSITMNTLFLTAFYCPLIPVAVIYSIVSLSLTYLIDKWVLLRRRRVSTALGATLSFEMIDMLELFLPIFCLSNILFDYLILPQENYAEFASKKFEFGILIHILVEASPYALAGFIIGIVHSILPTHAFNEQFFQLDDITLDMSYLEASNQYIKQDNYTYNNPATRSQYDQIFSEEQRRYKNLAKK